MLKGKSIDEFKQGDLIIRVEPIYQGTIDSLRKDFSYIGKPLKVSAIFMNYICLRDDKNNEVVLEDYIWNNGWSYYFPQGNSVDDLINKFNKENSVN